MLKRVLVALYGLKASEALRDLAAEVTHGTQARVIPGADYFPSVAFSAAFFM